MGGNSPVYLLWFREKILYLNPIGEFLSKHYHSNQQPTEPVHIFPTPILLVATTAYTSHLLDSSSEAVLVAKTMRMVGSRIPNLRLYGPRDGFYFGQRREESGSPFLEAHSQATTCRT